MSDDNKVVPFPEPIERLLGMCTTARDCDKAKSLQAEVERLKVCISEANAKAERAEKMHAEAFKAATHHQGAAAAAEAYAEELRSALETEGIAIEVISIVGIIGCKLCKAEEGSRGLVHAPTCLLADRRTEIVHLQGAPNREAGDEAHDASPPPNSGDTAGPAARRGISAELTTSPPDPSRRNAVVSVPREPTCAMLYAPSTIVQPYAAKLIWQRMYDAAPKVETSQDSIRADAEELANALRDALAGHPVRNADELIARYSPRPEGREVPPHRSGGSQGFLAQGKSNG